MAKKTETRLIKSAQILQLKEDSMIIKIGRSTVEIFPQIDKNIEIFSENFEIDFEYSLYEANDAEGNFIAMVNRIDFDKTISKYLDLGHEIQVKYSCVKKYSVESDYIVTEVIIKELKEKKNLLVEISSHKFVALDRIPIRFGDKFGLIQKNGFLLYCAFTGEGKTYFALNNIDTLLRSIDVIVILNYEITVDDYIERLAIMQSKHVNDILEKYRAKLYFVDTKNLETLFAVVEKELPNKNIAFIVDNIDNVIGGDKETENYQASWLIDFDRYIKANKHFGLVLSQMKKPTSERTSNDKLTSYDVSGSKNRVDLARTVMFTYYDRDAKKYFYRPLKQGSMKINGSNGWEFAENEINSLIKH